VGPGSPQLVSSLLERSAALRERNDLAAARVALTEAESIAAERLDKNDRRHLFVTLERGRLRLAEGDLVAAQSDLDAVIADLRKRDEPERLSDALCALAELRSQVGDVSGAKALLDEAATLRRRIMPASHPALAAVRRQLSALRTGGSIKR
jgi:tetratricopeptide (TPR) repeat protein